MKENFPLRVIQWLNKSLLNKYHSEAAKGSKTDTFYAGNFCNAQGLSSKAM